MIDLEKLATSFDVNNLDINQIIRFLTDQQKFIMLFLGIVCLIMGLGMFNDYHAKGQVINNKLLQEKDKISVIKARDQAVKDLSDFKSSLPNEVNQFDMITKISDDANKYQITIANMSPPDSRPGDLYDVIDFKFSAVADSFKRMMLFLRTLELSDPPMWINSWGGNEGADGRIFFQIEILAVHIHP